MPVLRQTLENGLTVLLQESHYAPVTTFWIWYRVGSRNEVPGITGIAHWTEHMLFKGSAAFPKGQIDKQIARNGGVMNGLTTGVPIVPAREVSGAEQPLHNLTLSDGEVRLDFSRFEPHALALKLGPPVHRF